MHIRIGIQFVEDRQEFLGGRGLRESMDIALDSCFLASDLFVPNVDLARRIVSYQNRY